MNFIGGQLEEVQGVVLFLATKGIDLRGFSTEVLKQSAVPILILHRSFEACRKCRQFEDCSLWSKGWVPVYDPGASRKYGWPYFRWRMCRYRLEHEEEKVQKRKRKTKVRVDDIGTEVPLEDIPREWL